MQTDVCAALSIWFFCAYAHTDTHCVGKLSITFFCSWKEDIPCKRGKTLGFVQPMAVGAAHALGFHL